jgi:hypothetical protein
MYRALQIEGAYATDSPGKCSCKWAHLEHSIEKHEIMMVKHNMNLFYEIQR